MEMGETAQYSQGVFKGVGGGGRGEKGKESNLTIITSLFIVRF